MKSWIKVVSKGLLALLVIDSVAMPLTALSETTSEGMQIRGTYLKDYQEDSLKLSITVDKEQTTADQLVVKLKAAEGEINEQGLTLVMQNGLVLNKNDQGQDVLPEGFTLDETYNENDKKIVSEVSETEDVLTDSLEQLPVYGEGYYSLKLKPIAERPIVLKTDLNDSNKRFEEHVFVFKKVADVRTGEMVAMTNEKYLAILKENESIFTNQNTTELDQSTKNPRGSGSITIQLRAYEENNPDPQVPLTDSEFEISPVDYSEQIMTGKTDLNGNVTFENIALGTYHIRQISSASDYNVDTQIEAVELTEAESSKTVRVINQPKESAQHAVRRSRSVSERATGNALATGTETYGITYANIDTFAYYQFQDGYATYGAGMDVKWKLPAEAKEGDYFTLNFGNQILLNRAPMYDEGEEVPYGSLDSVGDRYPETHIGNLFFQIVTQGSTTEPSGIPILNVYYTKAGELTFVVQRYANDKGAIEGEAVIGKLIDKTNLTAFTDGNGRHRSTRHIRPNNGGTDTKLEWDVYDLDEQIRKYDFYEGFYPNYMLMTEQAGATPTNGNPWFLGRSITYTSQYMNTTPVDFQDANGNPNLSGVYVNQRTQIFEREFDYGTDAQRTTSHGRETIFPVYEDRNYLYYYFVYNGNRNASGPGAWQTYLRPEGSELEIVDVKLFQGYNGQYASKQATSIVPPMATVDPYNPEVGGQVSTGKRFTKYNATEWKADFGGSEQNNTYFAIVKARKKTPSPEAADLNRLGYHMGMHSRQTIFVTRQFRDYYVPTEGFGAGWSRPEKPKDVVGDFKIKKTDPNREVVYPNYQKVNGAIQYQDDYGNVYTYNDVTKKYVDANGQSLTQKTDVQGNLLFEDNLNNLFAQKKTGNTITYEDANGVIYSKKAGEEDIYISLDGKVFRPSRPLLKDYEVTIKVDNSVVTDAQGMVYSTISERNGILDVVDRFGNILRVQKNSSGLNAWKFDSTTGSFVSAQVASQGNGYYKISALPISTTHLRPKLTETFSFKITDMGTGISFSHEVDEYGYAIFQSLLVGHTYRLEETSARVGYTRTPKVYLLTVTAVGQVSITDESGTPISTTTDPLSIVDASKLLYSVVNDVVRLKVKKVDEDGNLITSDKAIFNVYKSGDYTKNGNTIQPNAGAVPVASIQTSKVDGTNTLYGESEGIVIPNILMNVNYGIVETTAPAGYRILTSGIEVKLIQSGSTYVWQLVSGGDKASLEQDNLTLKVKNQADLASFSITKKIKGLESLNNLITTPVTFKLTKLNDTSFNPITLTQNANTRFTFNNLSKGVYHLEETSPPTGYVKSTTPYTVVVNKGQAELYPAGQGTTAQATGLTVIKSSHFDKGSLWGTNTEEKAFDGSDATVALYNLANNRLEAGQWWGVDLGAIKNVSHIRYLQGPAGGSGSNNDRMDSLELEYSVDGQNYQSLGTYNAPTDGQLGEVDTDSDIMARYIRVRNLRLKTDVWLAIKELSITIKNPISPSIDGVIDIGNIQNPSLRIEKQDINGQVIPQNIIFKLYKVDDATTSEKVASAIQENQLVQTFNLQNGTLAATMNAKVLGKYALVETQAPIGYTGLATPVLLELYESSQPHNNQLNKAVTRFRVLTQSDKVAVDDTTTATDNTLKIVVKNARNNFNLKLLKRDFENPNTGLSARFELYNADETRKLEQGNTTQIGNSLTFQNLQSSIYVLKEVTPPTGYNSINKIKFEITLDGRISILEGPEDLLVGQNANSNNEIGLIVKNRPFTDFSIEKVSNLQPTTNLTGVRLQIKAKNNGPAPWFSDSDWHIQHYQAMIDTANKSLTWWTQSNGIGNAVFKLPQGTYTISELAAPAGYELLQPFDIIVGEDGQVRLADGAPANAEINTKDNRINLKLTNIFKPKLKIIKVDGRDETRKLENATFKLFGEDGRTQVGNDLVTGTTGEIEIPALMPGTYYLQETQAPAGFQLNATKYKLIIATDGTITAENADDLIAVTPLSEEKVIQIKLKNKVKTYRLKIKKRDYDRPTDGVSGARFTLYPSEGPNEDGSNKVQVLINDRMTVLEDESYSHLDNTIDFPNIPPGEYVLRETQAPAGYAKIKDTRLRIGEDGRLTVLDADQAFVSVETEQGDTLVLIAKNIRVFTFQIKKVDRANAATLLDNAQFSIYKTNINWTKGDTPLAQGLTSKGIYQTTLEPGYYILKEDQAPSGYLLNQKEYRFQINHDGSIHLHNPDDTVALAPSDENRLVIFTMKNTRTTSHFKLAKRSYRDSTQRLEAQFELTESNNPQAIPVVKTTTTTGDEVLFDNLAVGKTYILKETVAPDGYQKIEKEFHINIGADGAISIQDGEDLISLDNTDNHLIIVKNLRKGEYPKTGGVGIIPYIALGGVMMFIAFAVEQRRKYTR
ncbi:TPA: discoidin domain-containing protein [Streptococcus suis]|nr:discoidin domain-containing protein [Streptococcus suis]